MSKSLDRYSMVTTRALLAVPSVRLFTVAASQGRMMRTDHTFARIDSTPAGRPAGVVVTTNDRQRIVGLLGISEDAWRKARGEWVDGRFAHHCQRGVDFLFFEPLHGAAATCPRCFVTLAHAQPGEELTVDVSGTHAPSTRIAASTSGSESSGGGWNGVEEGDDGFLPGLIGPEEAKRLLEGSSEARAPRDDKEALANIERVFGSGRSA